MADIDKFLNTWVSCIQTAGFGTPVGRIDRGFLHTTRDDVAGERFFVISFNKKDNPSARNGFSGYTHPKGLPCGWSLGSRGTQSFINMKPVTSCVNLGEI